MKVKVIMCTEITLTKEQEWELKQNGNLKNYIEYLWSGDKSIILEHGIFFEDAIKINDCEVK